VENERLVGEQARDHQRQGGVLGAGDRNRSVEPLAAVDANAIHAPSPVSGKRHDAARTAAPRCGKARTRRKAAAPGLALLFMPGDSGGIVGLTGARRAGTRRAGLGLGLATLEILPQRSAQTPLLAHLLRALSPLVHGLQDYDPTARDGSLGRDRPLNGSRLRPMWPCGKDRRTRGRFPIGRFSHPPRRCRSSVVEHPLGKGEVVSSILTGSTRKPRQITLSRIAPIPLTTFRYATKREQDISIRGKSVEYDRASFTLGARP